jgi:hypothetical protein
LSIQWARLNRQAETFLFPREGPARGFPCRMHRDIKNSGVTFVCAIPM